MQAVERVSLKADTSISEYLVFLSSLRRLVPEAVKKNERFLIKLQSELGKPLIEVRVGAEIDRAVISAASKRKTTWNGGRADSGEGMEFRLGQAAVCFFRWLYNEGHISRNPYQKNSFRRPPLQEAHFLTDDQVMTLLKYAEHLELRDQLMIRLLLDTGLRISEACRLKVSDIDIHERVINVQMTKVKRRKNPPFTKETQQLIEQWLKNRGVQSDYLFLGYSGRPLTDKQVRLRFRGISLELGFRVNPHALRHTAGTAWVEHAGQIQAMQVLGHVDAKITNHYTHLVGSKLRVIQEAIMDKKSWHTKMPNALISVHKN